jgi:protein-S-isoprenylcysteine O-methyltransferase Ste14
MSYVVRLVLIFGAWVLWVMPFFLFRPKKAEKAVEIRTEARWGIALESVGYFAIYLHTPAEWAKPLAPWRCAAGLVVAFVAIVLAWQSIRTLGRQWRVDAGLNADHELIRGGPYRFVRHPIYASMLGMLLSGIAWAGTLPLWPIALVVFVVGLEIRVRVEDSLLRERFGAEFTAWSREVPAYFPFVR